MPRFQDEHVSTLKRVMLKRVPECLFTPEDVDLIAEETGLNSAQIMEWAKNFRFRFSLEERENNLKEQKKMEVT